jgi:hypothetical protein
VDVTRIALITTTINVPTVLTQWVQTGMTSDDIIIVAGDKKSPHSAILELLMQISETTGVNTQYLTPEVQTARYPQLSTTIGWNCIQRRNIALLEAMKLHPKYVLTIDDDNAPTMALQVEQLIEIMEGTPRTEAPVISTNTGWYNPGRQCLTDDMRTVTHRGFPLSLRHKKPFHTYDVARPPIGVAAMLWTGEPDIDAVERIVNQPNVTRITGSVVLAPETWAPFNTQATMFRGDLAATMFMFPHVGRYDDIWASYVFRKIADEYGAYYGRPAVHQDRNEHNLVKDLEDEIFGMKHNETIIKAIRESVMNVNTTVLQDICSVYVNMMATTVLSLETTAAMSAWIDAVEAL